MQPGEPLAGKKRKRQGPAGSADAEGKRSSSCEELAGYEEAWASSVDDGEWCGRGNAGFANDGREDEEEAWSASWMR